MKKPEHSSTRRRIGEFLDRATQSIVGVFCLCLFPLFIIFSSLTQLYELKINTLRSETRRNMVQTLEVLDKYGSNRSYFHHLLKRIFDIAQQQKNPRAFLRKNITNLKNKYPHCLEFMVWDEKGKTITELTDQKGYKFIVAKLFETLKASKNAFLEDSSALISELPVFKKNKNFIGKFLGRFFIPEHLKFPYLWGKEAGAAKADFSDQRSDYWYQIGDKVSIFVFFSNKILEKSNGLKQMIKERRNHLSNQIIGYVQAPQISEISTMVPKDLRPDLMLALAKFEQFSPPVIETEKSIIAINVSGKNLRTFSIFRKNPAIWSVSQRRNSTLTKIVSIIALAYLLIYFSIFVMQVFVSIRIKLTMVFLFANLVPLIVLSFIGFDYLESKAISLKNDFIDSSFATLRDFDTRSESLKEDLRVNMLRACQKVNRESKGLKLSRAQISQLNEAVNLARPSECYIVSRDNEKIYEYFKDNMMPSYSNSYVIPMMSASLKFINGEIIKASTADLFKALLSPSNSELVRYARKNSGKICTLNTGNNRKTAYQFAFGPQDQLSYNSFLIMLWEFSNLNEQYVKKYFPHLVDSLSASSAFIRASNGSQFWPRKEQCPQQIQEFLEKVEVAPQSIYTKIFFNNKPHIAVGMKGRLLTTMVLANVIPEEALTNKIWSLKIYILLAIALNLLLTVAISLFLSHQFMKPIKELETATLAIGRRDFRHVIPQLDNDELGYLGTIFNRVTEGLGDLDVARIVQESLFPGNHFSAGSFKIFGRSIVMTTLGGDYYDCFEIDQQKLAIVIGDVAGHGVPAGLMMAMAKSAVLMSSTSQQYDPSELTKALHQMFFAIKNQNMKRMMTFQYYVLEHETGQFTFTNAGHCFPIIIDPESNTGEFIEHVFTPLGIGARARYKNYSFELKPGQALILYTDGIAEARNKDGENFGFERLKNTLPSLYDPDPEIYYNKILALYNNWTNEPDDDLTIIVTVREKS